MSNPFLKKIEQLNKIGIALSAQSDTTALLGQILESAQELTAADGGTLYRVINGKLHFDVILNRTLNIKMGGNYTKGVPFGAIPLTNNDGSANCSAVAAYVGNRGETVNIEDVYCDDRFDFSGALKFDQNAHYRTQSMLAIPLKDFEDEVIGVLQLINAQDETGQVVPFSVESESLARSLASQASVALTNRRLIDEHKKLFESFSKMVADAIDKKSPYTGKHCERVPVLTMMLAEAAINAQDPIFKDFTMNEAERYELQTAAWLHDCGKLTTPEYIMDKSTKLETVFDRIELVKTRLNLKAFQEIVRKHGISETEIAQTQANYLSAYERLKQINTGGEFLNDEGIDFLKFIAGKNYTNLMGEKESLLTDDELTNLMIQRGTLNDEERDIMQDHAAMSIHMLNMLPFPKDLKRVAEFAGGHHERMDGKGYPNHLKREELSIPARMMGIADIFEALSAGDRPYKEAKKLSESLKILGFMKKDGHVDPDLFNLFVREKVYLRYAESYLKPEQIDEVDPAKIPGYEPLPEA
ncbi:HD-GYP domain-containing protein [Thiosulfativibrio zosterae]|uniref:HD family phosphohydrolase n=1 Tax=Thiosulfativibrio zosterae TaxID=2675053 RepID=A0A6F8PQE4_9GAMM|nr:HD family phosphohydrolase [Thiosulfativibrio zosterae]BBP44352.1 HD family phosphohydrolase [Thiosulfativibrio zosterae]